MKKLQTSAIVPLSSGRSPVRRGSLLTWCPSDPLRGWRGCRSCETTMKERSESGTIRKDRGTARNVPAILDEQLGRTGRGRGREKGLAGSRRRSIVESETHKGILRKSGRFPVWIAIASARRESSNQYISNGGRGRGRSRERTSECDTLVTWAIRELLARERCDKLRKGALPRAEPQVPQKRRETVFPEAALESYCLTSPEKVTSDCLARMLVEWAEPVARKRVSEVLNS
jgi:hypothetical protein